MEDPFKPTPPIPPQQPAPLSGQPEVPLAPAPQVTYVEKIIASPDHKPLSKFEHPRWLAALGIAVSILLNVFASGGVLSFFPFLGNIFSIIGLLPVAVLFISSFVFVCTGDKVRSAAYFKGGLLAIVIPFLFIFLAIFLLFAYCAVVGYN